MLRTARAVYLATAATLLFVAPLRAQPREGSRPPCDQTIKTGTYRVVVTAEKTAPIEALVLFERLEGCLEATFIADGSPASGMQLLSVTNGVITARLRTADGVATVTFKPTETGLTGEILQGRKSWKLEGRKTA